METAALLRDQIMAIDRVAAGQKVVMESDTEMDVIALAGTTHAVCAAVLRYRDGRLTDKREFLSATRRTSTPCGRNFCRSITSTARRSLKRLPWTPCRPTRRH